MAPRGPCRVLQSPAGPQWAQGIGVVERAGWRRPEQAPDLPPALKPSTKAGSHFTMTAMHKWGATGPQTLEALEERNT